jgi:hypothetical protein
VVAEDCSEPSPSIGILVLQLLTTLLQLHRLCNTEWYDGRDILGELYKEEVAACFKYYPNICLEGPSTTAEEFNEDSRPESRDSNMGLPKYEAERYVAYVNFFVR